MTDEERRRWEASAERGDSVRSEEPAAVVRESIGDLPGGRALDVATGEGRNAIFLAERGWTVDAVDISRTMLERGRERAAARSVAVEWILADVDEYCFPEGAYDVVTISYFDARHRLPAVKAALAPGGALVYEHHLRRRGSGDGGPGARYRFEPNELRTACSDLTIRRYDEDRERDRVTMVAYADDSTS